VGDRLPGSAADPLWYKDAVIYELHVRGFCDSNDDGIGDFRGLIHKLDYLQELGVTCLWILPFFPSPLRDDGYDISDYLGVHPAYGTLEDVREFVQEAHRRDLQVMFELVINHTSDQHPWFQQARISPPGSPEHGRYVWSDTDDKYRGARIIFTDTEQSNWTWDRVAQRYYWHRFFSHQPDLNYDNPLVTDDIVSIMRFWLDAGVDAFRLDAVPYLYEREGTNCENLPETHEAIKRLRREMDAEHANRMILAEANQWPTDVSPYFGNGDECHMAFHFPLMPRLFMALRLEDRHPILDILEHTPDIPPECQWALFLRNHDELTLEMVSDEERDYMYLAYSADPRMRLNVGIRRRLAPLVDNNRRRMELLNSVLLSFPGTPVIYYGDEIGMGDNIYLGDRNGVRTPMQWSADRNAGFSRANPSRLYSPVIMDPMYGYEAVNVEAQQGDPSSLLSWMRNMIALRKVYRVFGRGSTKFLDPANRKVLAYVREYENERVLCVANLSRFAQPVDLDLSSFAGSTPIEMLGYTEFPGIERHDYPLTLAPYGFYWFELQAPPESVRIEPAAEESEGLRARAGTEWADLLAGAGAANLLGSALPRFLPAQRWFGARTLQIEAVDVVDWCELTRVDQATSALVLLRVVFQSGEASVYAVPMAIRWDGQEEAAPPSDSTVCALTDGRRQGVLFDGMRDPRTCTALLEIARGARQTRLQRGVAHGVRGAAAPVLQLSTSEVRPLGAEQSNSSVAFGGSVYLKLYRRVDPGPNAEVEMNGYLAAARGFPAVPQFYGALEYVSDQGPRSTLGMLQELVQNQGDGWSWTLDELGRYYENAMALPASRTPQVPGPAALLPAPPAEEENHDEAAGMIAAYLESAATLGRRTAQMHLALSMPSDNEAFAPETCSASDLARLAAELRDRATRALDDLRLALPQVADEAVESASGVLSRRRQVIEWTKSIEELEPGSLRIRVHGDYHLGQVLRVKNDFMIVDFEGEPARTPEQRRAKDSPLKDIAGMLRSFGYAANEGMRLFVLRGCRECDRLQHWASFWERRVRNAFLRGYTESAGSTPLLPPDHRVAGALLQAYLLDKAFYELRYEMNSRPSWVRTALSGMLPLIELCGGSR
jgi:maltose alpha-D-glucosyltransferase/alpha-amylase